MVAKLINKPCSWAAKHYTNSFKGHLYNKKLNDYHKMVINKIMLKVDVKYVNEAILLAKNALKDTNVFPRSIESYIYQNFKEIKKGEIYPKYYKTRDSVIYTLSNSFDNQPKPDTPIP